MLVPGSDRSTGKYHLGTDKFAKFYMLLRLRIHSVIQMFSVPRYGTVRPRTRDTARLREYDVFKHVVHFGHGGFAMS